MHSLERSFTFMKYCDMITPFCIVFNYCFECLKYKFIIFNFHTNFTGISISRMDMQYREHSMQNEYTFDWNFIYLQSYF